MTRKEEIKQASNELFDDVIFHSETYKIGFKAGAMWADNHPKSPWISVEDDLPCNHEELITTDDYYEKETINVITMDKLGVIEDNYMVLCDEGEWKWKYGATPLYWMLIPKLPKE